jgi:hypothetical protein
MPTPTTETLATLLSAIRRYQPIGPCAFQQGLGAREVGLRAGEGHIRLALVLGDVLDDHVHVDVGFGQRRKDRGNRAGAIRDPRESDLGSFLSAAMPVISWRSISYPSSSSSATIIVPGIVSAAGASSSMKDDNTCTRTFPSSQARRNGFAEPWNRPRPVPAFLHKSRP